MSYAASRSRYVSDAVSTASPAALLIMLYDRLLLDLERGEALITNGDRNGASIELQHAQEIVMELRMSLNVESWEGGAGLECALQLPVLRARPSQHHAETPLPCTPAAT